MSKSRDPRCRRRSRPPEIHKARGIIHPRVQQVGPEHFGVVCVDPAKNRSYWMLADFYGKVLVPTTIMEHTRPGFDASLRVLKEAMSKHQIRDLTVSVERTGNYHVRPKKMFEKAGFETRTIHGRTTNHFRQPADDGNKTDDTDLFAQHRATVNGFGLIEQPLEPLYAQLQLLVRHRRDLVRKCVVLRCQIQEHLHLVMPGYARCFDSLFESNIALLIARHTGSGSALSQAGVKGLTQILQQAKTPFQQRSLPKLIAWAAHAAESLDHADIHQRIWTDLDDDRRVKGLEIARLEREIAGLLVATPYVLLMSIPGINVVSAAEFAAEAGPMANYATPRSITGRAGLYPSRYQSDQVDHANGPLVRSANRTLRNAIMLIADNLVGCNAYFKALAKTWSQAGRDPRAVRVRVACRFSRIAYHMVSGQMVFNHPSCQQRDSILDKLIVFHRGHDTPCDQVLRDLKAAALQLSPKTQTTEEPQLASELADLVVKLKANARRVRTRGPRLLGDILLDVLIQRGFHAIESQSSGE
jgi:transposase